MILMKNCVFCKISNHESPASIVYEDDWIMAFMDIRPVRPGMMLIIPKGHVDHYCDITDDVAVKIAILGQRLARNIRLKLSPERVGMVVHGYGVGHAHLLLVPLHGPDDITSAGFAFVQDGQVRFDLDRIPMTSRERLDELAIQLK